MKAQVVVLVGVAGLVIGCGSSGSGGTTGPKPSDPKGAGGQGGGAAPDGGGADASSADPVGGAGGAAGAPLANPGFGGFPGDETPSCAVLETQYANTVAGAQTCDVNGAAQCQQVVNATLSVCPSCMTYVQNAGIVTAIQYDWMDKGCAAQPAQNCPPLTCPAMTGGKCVASTTGGTCSSN